MINHLYEKIIIRQDSNNPDHALCKLSDIDSDYKVIVFGAS